MFSGLQKMFIRLQNDTRPSDTSPTATYNNNRTTKTRYVDERVWYYGNGNLLMDGCNVYFIRSLVFFFFLYVFITGKRFYRGPNIKILYYMTYVSRRFNWILRVVLRKTVCRISFFTKSTLKHFTSSILFSFA